jgi:enolase
MSAITEVIGREVLDSRGLPTVEVEITLDSGHIGRMIVPSGASTGRFEAHELRDGDPSRYQGKGVLKAVANINGEIAHAITGKDPALQQELDVFLINLDGSSNKKRLGANAILGVSFAVARAAASAAGLPFFRYLAQRYLPSDTELSIPLPMVNIISGGLHAGRCVDIQDYLVMPIGAGSYSEGLEQISAVWWATREILAERGHIASLVADEGGFGPLLEDNEEPLKILCNAMERVGLDPGTDMAIALDVAATHFYDTPTGEYVLDADAERLTREELIDRLSSWVDRYPIISIEDGLVEDDWDGWVELTKRLGNRIRLVGDDFFTTNPDRIRRGIDLGAANAVLVKNNQIGTLSETVEAVNLARSAGYTTVISARSGETEDSTLADLAVGLGGDQIKVGSLTRSSRLSKYNQLLRIAEELAV